MKYYDILFLGLIRLARRTTYEEIAEYVASWSMALIIELNLIVILGLIGANETFFRAYVLVALFILLLFLNLRYYSYRQSRIMTSDQRTEKHGTATLTFAESLGLFFIIESVAIPIIFAVTR